LFLNVNANNIKSIILVVVDHKSDFLLLYFPVVLLILVLDACFALFIIIIA